METETTASAASAANANAAAKASHVTWDEETIALHDVDRGTRMKIEEPKTPYHYYASDHEEEVAASAYTSSRTAGSATSSMSGDVPIVSPAGSLSGKEAAGALQWSELQTKLEKVQDTTQGTSNWDTSSEEGDGSPRLSLRDAEGKKLVPDPKFSEKRKRHYNEYQRVKEWRAAHMQDDEDEEEEEEAKQKRTEAADAVHAANAAATED